MAQYFNLELDTTAPSGGGLVVNSYYNDSTAISVTLPESDCSFMKLWVDQTAAPTAAPTAAQWIAAATTWTPTLTVEGTNYVHVIFMDNVGNEGSIINSSAFIYDTTIPVISQVSINDGAAMTSTTNVVVRVTASDAKQGIDVSDIKSTELTGDIVLEEGKLQKIFLWTDEDRAAGYKDCQVTLTALEEGKVTDTRTVTAKVVDRAENISEPVSDSITLYTGSISFVIDLRDPDDHEVKAGDYTNKNAWTVCLDFGPDAAAQLVTGYKVWGDINTDGGATPTEKPDAFTPWSGTATDVCIDIEGLKFTSGTAEKKVYAELRVNEGGSEVTKTADPKVVNYSIETPVITVDALDPDILSDKTGYNSTVVSASIEAAFTDTVVRKVVGYATAEAATAGTYEDSAIVGMSETDPGTTFEETLTEANLVSAVPSEGAKFLVMYAKDQCGNWGKSDTIQMYVDVTGPVVAWGTINPYYNAPSGFTVSASDSPAGMDKMKVWVDSSATTSEAPVRTTEYNYSENPTSAQVNWDNVIQGENYAHIIYTDKVGNTTLSHSSAFVYDNVAPTGTVAFRSTHTNALNQTIDLSYSDATSGVTKMKVWGDINDGVTEEDAEWIDAAATLSITLKENASTEVPETKVIYAKFKDAAENVSNQATANIVLDQHIAAPVLGLYDKDNAEALAPFVKVVDFVARIGSTVDASDIDQYALYGDFDGSVGEEDWKDFVVDTGKDYMSVTDLEFTDTDGEKTVYVKIKDKAGNVAGPVSVTVTLDTSIPVIDVADVDYNVISKVHVDRRTGAGVVIEGAFGDMMTFSWSCGEKLTAYKVCVNAAGQEAETAVAIGTSGGSVNMSGGVVEADTTVNCVIMGADFAATNIVNDTDGVYEVIVYGKDVAGNWSAVHSI